MSHNSEEYIVCPNCGKPAVDNYCSHCGQPTHLHKETFGSLILHFLGHYFHYDSMFWKTLRALCFHPGKLTIAYWNKQRARYIAPISLYIFISFVFFFCFLTIIPSQVVETANSPVSTTDSADYARFDSTVLKVKQHFRINVAQTQNNKDHKKVTLESLRERKQRGDKRIEAFLHFLPKIFFFMIPLMAMILSMLFFRRKETNFVDHTIFSLHIHSFFFLIFLIPLLNPLEYWSSNEKLDTITDYLDDLLLLLGFIYIIVALRNAYKVKWGRAVAYSFIISVGYLIMLILAFGVYLFIVALLAKYHLSS